MAHNRIVLINVSIEFDTEIHTRTDADRRHACKLCPQKFFHSKDLRTHETKHMGLKRKQNVVFLIKSSEVLSTKKYRSYHFTEFHCDFCDNSYKYNTDLAKHLRTHFDGKIYECTTCHQRFKYALELQRHSVDHYQNDKSKNQEESTEKNLNE